MGGSSRHHHQAPALNSQGLLLWSLNVNAALDHRLAADGKGLIVADRKRVDWEAVERDYRTGSLSLRELGVKHGVDNAAIARKKKKEGWTQDLTSAVRQATNAALIQEIVSTAVSEGQQSVSTAVMAAAEVNRQVIVGHRKALQQLESDALSARARLLALAEGAADVREAAAVVTALEASGRTLKLVIEGQRKAFGLDDEDEKGDKGAVTVNVVRFSDA